MAKVIVLSGAGLSAESGISTFRENGGLWDEYDISVVCNYDSLEKNEDICIEFYDRRRSDLESKKPNYAHKVLVELKKKYKEDIALITQNVDNLFEKAGADKNDVIHLHGFLTSLKCRNLSCNFNIDIGYKAQNKVQGVCPKCQSKLRPDIVFFGEMAPMYEVLNYELNDCEMFVVIGTSGYVIGVNTIANFCQKSILNNLEPSDAIEEELFSKVLYKKATEAIDEIKEDIENFLKKS